MTEIGVLEWASAFGPVLREAFPERPSRERAAIAEALGAEVVKRASWLPPSTPDDRQGLVDELARFIDLTAEPRVTAKFRRDSEAMGAWFWENRRALLAALSQLHPASNGEEEAERQTNAEISELLGRTTPESSPTKD